MSRRRDARPTQRLLLAVLRDYERRGQRFTLTDLVEATGYKPSTIKTYIGKRLAGRLTVPDDEHGYWRARGALAMSETDFATYMSQKALGGGLPGGEAEWRGALDQLLRLGLGRGYALGREQANLIARLRGVH